MKPSQKASAPFLRRIAIVSEKVDPTRHPFNVEALRGLDLALRSRVTFFVGENGSGKSTLLEAVAQCCGFNLRSGALATAAARLPEGDPRSRGYGPSAVPDRQPLTDTARLPRSDAAQPRRWSHPPGRVRGHGALQADQGLPRFARALLQAPVRE